MHTEARSTRYLSVVSAVFESTEIQDAVVEILGLFCSPGLDRLLYRVIARCT